MDLYQLNQLPKLCKVHFYSYEFYLKKCMKKMLYIIIELEN